MKRKHILVIFVILHLIRKGGLRLTFSLSMGPGLSVLIVRKHFVEKIIELNIESPGVETNFLRNEIIRTTDWRHYLMPR